MSAQKPTFVGVVVCIIFFFLPYSVFADIRINEFSPQTNPEWIELYNPDDSDRSLSGVELFFSDSIESSQKVTFCSNTTLASKAYARIVRAENSYVLANSGDTLILKREDDVIDTISFGSGKLLPAPVGTQSATRNDVGEWGITDNPSPMGDSINFVCPTATPTNTTAPTHTNTPTPTVSPTSFVPTHTPTDIPKVTISASPTEILSSLTVKSGEESSISGLVLGQTTSTDKTDKTQTSLLQEKRPYIVALAFVGIGLALLGAVYVVKIRLYSKE